MPQRDKESIPLLHSAAETLAAVIPSRAVTQDEENFDTLKAVEAILQNAVEALYKDFNAFEMPDGVPKTTVLFSLMRKIEAKKEAYNILAPIADSVRDAVIAVDNKYKEG